MSKSFETFKSISQYEISNLTRVEPSAFNGNVEIKKYRVTIEEITESTEVYHQRLQKLWDECDNHHHWNPLKSMAKKFGYELKGSAGKDRWKN